MNAVELYKFVGELATQVPIVHSFYAGDIYSIWNTQEIKYGSVVFAIKGVSNDSRLSTFNAVIYFGDRLNEDGTNTNAIQTDATTALQAIIGSINQNDGSIQIEYPVQITLFEQKFADELAGAYAEINIVAENSVSECGYALLNCKPLTHDDFYTKPEIDTKLKGIVARFGDYYIKEEIDNKLKGYLTEAEQVEYLKNYYTIPEVNDIVAALASKKLVEDSVNKINDKLNLKANTSDLKRYMPATDINAKLDLKADKSEISDMETKTHAKASFQPKGDYLTEVPKEYVTDAELIAKDYAQRSELTGFADKSEIVDMATNTSVNEKLTLKADKSEIVDMETKTDANLKFQPKGEYQPVGDYVTQDELAEMDVVTKAEIANKADKSEIEDMLTKTAAKATYQPKGEYQPKGDYVIPSQIADMETKTAAKATYQPIGNYATKNDIADMETKADAKAKFQPKGKYLTEVPAEYVTDAELTAKDYAQRSELVGFVDKTEIADMETKTDANLKFQPKGDYQPAGSYQPAGDYVTQDELATLDVATKADIANKADKTELDAYVKTTVANDTYQVKGDYASKSDLTDKATLTYVDGKFQLKGNYATKNDIADMETKTDAKAKFQPKGKYLTEVPKEYVTDAELIAKDYATKTELDGKLDKSDLSNYLTKDIADKTYQKLGSYALKSDLDNYLSIGTAANTYQPIGNYATAGQISDMETKTHARLTYQPKGSYVTDTSLSSELTNYLTINSAAATYQPIGTYALKSDLESKQDLLVSGLNIKTINGEILLGPGDIVIEGGSGGGVGKPGVGKYSEVFNNGDKQSAFGEYSHAEGFNTSANGTGAHSEGCGIEFGPYISNEAIGTGAHVEGYANLAGANGAHAEGGFTKANGLYSHAEGYGKPKASTLQPDNFVTADGMASHAEGLSTKATGEAAHSEGNNSVAKGNYSHAEGGFTTFNEIPNPDIYSTPSDNEAPVANGIVSHAEGTGTVANANCAHVEGFRSKAGGNGPKVGELGVGMAAHAEGVATYASNLGAHSEGVFTTAEGQASHATGWGSIANNYGQCVVGRGNVKDFAPIKDVDWSRGTVLWQRLKEKPLFVVGLGFDRSPGADSHNRIPTDGIRMLGNGDLYIKGIGGFKGSEAIADLPNASIKSLQKVLEDLGPSSGPTAANFNTINGESVWAGDGPQKDIIIKAEAPVGQKGTGTDSEVFNTYSGENANHASGVGSHAEGRKSRASGEAAHAEGYGNTSNGLYSHSEGYTTSARGDASHTEGNGTVTTNLAEHAEGKYNSSTEGMTISSIGIGRNNETRSNAFEVTSSGEIYMLGLGEYVGNNPLQAVDVVDYIKTLEERIKVLEAKLQIN